jgi:hypothetical protein
MKWGVEELLKKKHRETENLSKHSQELYMLKSCTTYPFISTFQPILLNVRGEWSEPLLFISGSLGLTFSLKINYSD